MTVRVQLFGEEARRAGRDCLSLVFIEEHVNCDRLRARISEDHPELAPLLRSARFAVNNTFATGAQSVAESDEVAVIGMVSGG